MRATTRTTVSLIIPTLVWLITLCHVQAGLISPYNSAVMADVVKPDHVSVDIADVSSKIIMYKYTGEWNLWTRPPLIFYGMFFPMWPMEGIWFEEGMQEVIADTRWGYKLYDERAGGYPEMITWVNNSVNDDNIYYEWWSTPAATPSHVGKMLGNWSQGFVFNVTSAQDHILNVTRVKSSSPGISFSFPIPKVEIPVTVTLAPGEDMAYGERELLIWKAGVTNTTPCL